VIKFYFEKNFLACFPKVVCLHIFNNPIDLNWDIFLDKNQIMFDNNFYICVPTHFCKF